MIDDIDAKILSILQRKARTSNAEIARAVGMAQSATLERVRKLEERGVILGYEARLQPAVLGLDLLAFIAVRTIEPAGTIATAEALAAIPEVLEVHHVAGEDCYLVKVRAAGTAALGNLLRAKIGAIAEITSTRTIIVMETIKETAELPLPGSA